jgi:hypothetical protein
LLQFLDLVTVAAFQRKRREICVDGPAESHVRQVTKLMKALKHATDSINSRAAFLLAGLIGKARVFPSLGLMDSGKLNGMIDNYFTRGF